MGPQTRAPGHVWAQEAAEGCAPGCGGHGACTGLRPGCLPGTQWAAQGNGALLSPQLCYQTLAGPHSRAGRREAAPAQGNPRGAWWKDSSAVTTRRAVLRRRRRARGRMVHTQCRAARRQQVPPGSQEPRKRLPDDRRKRPRAGCVPGGTGRPARGRQASCKPLSLAKTSNMTLLGLFCFNESIFHLVSHCHSWLPFLAKGVKHVCVCDQAWLLKIQVGSRPDTRQSARTFDLWAACFVGCICEKQLGGRAMTEEAPSCRRQSACIFLSRNSLFQGESRFTRNPLECKMVQLLQNTAWRLRKH